MSKKEQREGSLSEQLNEDVLTRLRLKKTELKQSEAERLEQEKQKRLEERKKKEANKSFEELLNESELDWKTFKK